MATVIMLRWDDAITPEQYAEIRSIAALETDPPEGLRVHLATFDGGVLRMLDVWDSQEQYDEFVAARIAPALEKVGVAGAPALKLVSPLHDLVLA